MIQLAITLIVVVATILGSCAASDNRSVRAQRSQAKSEKVTVMISTAKKEDIIPISARELPAARARADKGDIDAINKLIGYYLQHDKDAEAQKWSHRREEILAKRRGQ